MYKREIELAETTNINKHIVSKEAENNFKFEQKNTLIYVFTLDYKDALLNDLVIINSKPL